MHDRIFTLATDLDGTFLGGSEHDRKKLYSWFDQNRDTAGLIFVTGRDLPFIEELCESTFVPWPDFVIGDVGTTIAAVHNDADENGRRIRPVPSLEEEIKGLWGEKSETVRQTLKDAPGLKLQDTPFRYRVSYHYDPETYDPSAEKKVKDLGLDPLISANQFFDVLPPGISKGPSLLRLLEHLSSDTETVLVAGDTLNDYSLFETGLKGVAVGNSEQGLIDRLNGHTNTHLADGHGAAGIAEAIRHFDLHPKIGAA